MRTRVILMLTGLLAASLAVIGPAQAASRVGIANQLGTGKVDPKYATTLTVSGSGFQSVKGGHGGIYVFFGTTKGQWRPSKGGQTGRNYLYVPDSETKSNQGFQKFVAFPDSDTAGSANGGTIKANGTWSTTMVVPGATFKAANRDGNTTTVNCLKVTCGIITVGAHGVKNARNETFTPVTFADLYAGKSPAPAAGGTTAAAAPTGEVAASKPKASGKPALTVDRTTAVAGRVLTFNATGLTPGDQIVASLDDGLAAVGPLNVGPNGQVAGTLALPTTIDAGTHELRLSGTATAPSVTFPVSAAAASEEQDNDSVPWLPIGFAAFGGLALLAALAFSLVRLRSLRRRTVHAV